MNDREAFTSAFRQSRKNIPIFSLGAYVLTLLPNWLGIFRLGITSLGAILYALFMLQAIFTTLLSLFSLVTWPLRPHADKLLMQPTWVAAGALLTTFDTVVYAACFYFIGRASSWWGMI
jgi:hypothetical protein